MAWTCNLQAPSPEKPKPCQAKFLEQEARIAALEQAMAALRLSQAPAPVLAPSPAPAAVQPVPAVSAGEPPAKPVPAASVPAAAAVPALAALVGEPKGDGNATILGYNGFPMQMPDWSFLIRND